MAYSPQQSRQTLSERFYRLLIQTYPRSFRAEYAHEMLLVFRDALYDASRQGGLKGVFRLWRDTFEDYAKSVCHEYVRDWITRGQSRLALAGKDQFPMSWQFALEVAQQTDVGRKRSSNEDNLHVVVPTNPQTRQQKGALFVVSDGMGGHEKGEVASQMTIQAVTESYYQAASDATGPLLQQAIQAANALIYQAGAGQGGNGMGATCVAAVLHEQQLSVANVGDSRAYLLHAGELRQITRDHSYVAELVEKGEITPAEARIHEKRNIITRSLGAAPTVAVDLFQERVEEGDTLILCTDGLSGVLEDQDLAQIVQHFTPEESVQQLIAQANAAGGPDNVTAIVVRVSAA